MDLRGSLCICFRKAGRRASLAMITLLFAVAAVDTLAAETAWSRIETAAAGTPTAVGSPSNGCIQGASALPAAGVGYASIRRHRNRYYGHPETIRLVQKLGDAMHRRNGKLVMVGDLAQPRGGRMSSSHVSHQNGLDADIWLMLADSPAQAVRSTPESRDPPSMLGRNKLDLNGNWGPTSCS